MKKKQLKTPAVENLLYTPLIDDALFNRIVLFIFFVVGLVGVFQHEMWRDELEMWLVPKVSTSIADFFQRMRPGGNPLIWLISNFIVSRFTDNPFYSLLINFLFSVLTVYLVLKYSPFPRIHKILFCFGYYVLFEYGLIARGYVTTLCFLILFCSLYGNKTRFKYVYLGIALLLLANGTGAHGIILSMSLLTMMLIDYFFEKRVGLKKIYSAKQVLTGVAIALLGVWLAVYTTIPKGSTDSLNTWFQHYDSARFVRNFLTIWNAFVPIPYFFSKNFWNTNILNHNALSSLVQNSLLLISGVIFLFTAIVFSRKLSVVFFYLMALVGMLLFSYLNSVIYIVYGARYHGFLFLTFFAAYWLMHLTADNKFPTPILNSLRVKLNLEKYIKPFFISVLVLNFSGGLIAYSMDFVLPFSAVTKTGKYIVEKKWDQMPTTGFVDYAVSPIAAFTQRPIYFPDRDTTNTYVIFTTDRYSTDGNVIIGRMLDYIHKQKDSVLVVLNFELGTNTIGDIFFEKKQSFLESVVKDEVYTIYIAKQFNLQNELSSDAQTVILKDKAEYLLSVANSMLQQNKLSDAEVIIQKIILRSKGEKISRVHNMLGMLYARKNMLEDAKKEFHREIDLNLGKEEAYFQLGMVYYQTQKTDSALYCWEEALKINPSNVDAMSNAAVVYFNVKKDVTKAKQLWENAVSLNPKYFQVYVNLMMLCQNKKDDECKTTYLRAALINGMQLDEIRSKGIVVTDQMLARVKR